MDYRKPLIARLGEVPISIDLLAGEAKSIIESRSSKSILISLKLS